MIIFWGSKNDSKKQSILLTKNLQFWSNQKSPNCMIFIWASIHLQEKNTWIQCPVWLVHFKTPHTRIAGHSSASTIAACELSFAAFIFDGESHVVVQMFKFLCVNVTKTNLILENYFLKKISVQYACININARQKTTTVKNVLLFTFVGANFRRAINWQAFGHASSQ